MKKLSLTSDDCIRIATMNNFDFSAPEINQLRQFEQKHPEAKFFVNSNVFTELTNIENPVVVTINPYLTKVYEPKGYTRNVRALRFKLIYSDWSIDQFKIALKIAKKFDAPLLITFFRAKSKISREKLGLNINKYKYIGNYFRLLPSAKKELINIIETIAKNMGLSHLVKYCDKNDLGCPSCMNCSKLTFGKKMNLYGLNLSSSGVNGHCKYKCQDCFAKALIVKNKGYLDTDTIKQNAKMIGK